MVISLILPLRSLILSSLYLFPLCFAYIIDITPSTAHPAPLDRISWDITVGTGDPTVVNILLTSTSRGNTTVVADSTDLSKNSKGTFDVPFVPPGSVIFPSHLEANTDCQSLITPAIIS